MEEERTSPGGIVIPDSAAEKPIRGKVTAVGNGKILDDGSVHAFGDSIARIFCESDFFCRHFLIYSLKNNTELETKIGDCLALNNGHDVFFTHYEKFITVHFHLSTGVFSEEHLVTNFHVQSANTAII